MSGMERGASENRERAGSFQYAYLHHSEALKLPSWSMDAVTYQIYPSSYNEGTLQGISDKMPYLQQLGVNVVYMTPVFESPSEHKYNTSDYYKVDPVFGDTEGLKALVGQAHRHGIKVILDAVFNHSGDRFFAFKDVLAKESNLRIKIGSSFIPFRLRRPLYPIMKRLPKLKRICQS